jgi:uncharacterized protein YjiS (DUF1127 family)
MPIRPDSQRAGHGLRLLTRAAEARAAAHARRELHYLSEHLQKDIGIWGRDG